MRRAQISQDEVNARLSFIRSLELAESPAPRALQEVTPYPGAALVESEDQAGYVDSGSLVSFVAGLTRQQKSDTLNSTLLAQLAANKQYDRERQPREWYAYYREVLENVGWVVQEWDFTEFQTGGSTVSVYDTVIKVLGAIATGNQLAIVIATMDALNDLPEEDDRVVLFETESHSQNQGAFQVSSAEDSDGVVVMRISAFHFQTTETVTRLLWLRFSGSSTSFYQGAQTINLNEDVYAIVRRDVLQKLGDRAVNFVRNLDI